MSDPAKLLTPYMDGKTTWTRRDAAHLLWRVQFGATHDEVEQAHRAGLEATVRQLTTPRVESASFERTAKTLRHAAEVSNNIRDLKTWWLFRMLQSANPLVEKMTLLLHNHFATSFAKVKEVIPMAAQNDSMRQYALGSFRTLLQAMARDVAMLVWLDSNDNRKRAPNENFARELMELFSLGIGNYTEKDIKEAAKAFTGWHVREGHFWFDKNQHDFGTKTVFGKTANLDGGEVVDLCLSQDACPRFLASKILRMFLTHQPDRTATEALAQCIRQHDYNLAPVLQVFLQSKLFFASTYRHALIKSPLDVVLGTFRALETRPNLQAATELLAALGQDIFEPPTVKGWEGGRLWINSALMLQRTNFAADLFEDKYGTAYDPERTLNRHRLVDSNKIVHYYLDLLLARDVDDGIVRDLAKAHANQTDKKRAVRELVHMVLALPEYQLH